MEQKPPRKRDHRSRRKIPNGKTCAVCEEPVLVWSDSNKEEREKQLTCSLDCRVLARKLGLYK